MGGYFAGYKKCYEPSIGRPIAQWLRRADRTADETGGATRANTGGGQTSHIFFLAFSAHAVPLRTRLCMHLRAHPRARGFVQAPRTWPFLPPSAFRVLPHAAFASRCTCRRRIFFHHFDLFFSRGMHQRLPPSLPARPRASTHAPVRSCERAHACTHPESLSIREAVVASAARACIAWRVCGRAGGPARVPLVHKVASSANATLRTSAAARFWVRSADPDP